MIYETRSSTVVMLTREVEGGKSKCEHYWPNEGEPAVIADVRETNKQNKQTQTTKTTQTKKKKQHTNTHTCTDVSCFVALYRKCQTTNFSSSISVGLFSSRWRCEFIL
jgi:protein tyrosine phosphatase